VRESIACYKIKIQLLVNQTSLEEAIRFKLLKMFSFFCQTGSSANQFSSSFISIDLVQTNFFLHPYKIGHFSKLNFKIKKVKLVFQSSNLLFRFDLVLYFFRVQFGFLILKIDLI